MKIRIPFLFLTIIFLVIFFVFYKGLQNSNIYTPNNNIEKDLPNFQTKMFNEDREIFLRDIFFAWLTCESNFGRNFNNK